MSPVTRYIGSQFLRHSNTDNLLAAINKATAWFDQEKIINIGMDRPSTNHKFLRLLRAQRAAKWAYIIMYYVNSLEIIYYIFLQYPE